MKQVQAYRCEHCGKVYLMKSACLEHEAHRCPHNPENRPLCYDCKHYQPSMEADNKERVVWYTDSPWGDVEHMKKFDPNRCSVLGCKLFNNIKLSDEVLEALDENDYTAMPLPSNGCVNFVEAEDDKPTNKVIFR